MRPRLLLPVVAVLAATQLGADACDGSVIDDPGFDLWCGDQLCSWDVDSGEIRRVPTWHRGDDGVELVGPDGAISQLSSVSNSTCIRFEMIAGIEETAEVELSLDLGNDGTIDHTERVPTTDWRRVSFLLSIAPPYTGIRFRLARRGLGRAVLANIGAEIAEGCAGVPIRSMPPAPGSRDDVRGTLDGAGGSP